MIIIYIYVRKVKLFGYIHRVLYNYINVQTKKNKNRAMPDNSRVSAQMNICINLEKRKGIPIRDRNVPDTDKIHVCGDCLGWARCCFLLPEAWKIMEYSGMGIWIMDLLWYNKPYPEKQNSTL